MRETYPQLHKKKILQQSPPPLTPLPSTRGIAGSIVGIELCFKLLLLFTGRVGCDVSRAQTMFHGGVRRQSGWQD